MTLQDQIYKTCKIETNKEKRNILKVIIGELQRQPRKILSNDEVIKILKTLEKNELERLEKANDVNALLAPNFFLDVVRCFIPVQLSKKEIVVWIAKNVDFSKLKNKLQAVSIVTKQFGQLVDGNLVKEIVLNWKE